MLKMRWLASVLGLGCLLLVFACSLATAQQAAIDPQSLIGKWSGTTSNREFRSFSSSCDLTITSATGDEVIGRLEWSGNGPFRPANFPVTGRLNANVLTLEGAQYSAKTSFEFTVFGKRMEGNAFLGQAHVFSFVKQ